jgi:hypothetical protein
VAADDATESKDGILPGCEMEVPQTLVMMHEAAKRLMLVAVRVEEVVSSRTYRKRKAQDSNRQYLRFE